jgi:hypothetical protein
MHGVGEPETVTPESVVGVPVVQRSKTFPVVVVVTVPSLTDSKLCTPMLAVPPDVAVFGLAPGVVPVVLHVPSGELFLPKFWNGTLMSATPSDAER